MSVWLLLFSVEQNDLGTYQSIEGQMSSSESSFKPFTTGGPGETVRTRPPARCKLSSVYANSLLITNGTPETQFCQLFVKSFQTLAGTSSKSRTWNSFLVFSLNVLFKQDFRDRYFNPPNLLMLALQYETPCGTNHTSFTVHVHITKLRCRAKRTSWFLIFYLKTDSRSRNEVIRWTE